MSQSLYKTSTRIGVCSPVSPVLHSSPTRPSSPAKRIAFETPFFSQTTTTAYHSPKHTPQELRNPIYEKPIPVASNQYLSQFSRNCSPLRSSAKVVSTCPISATHRQFPAYEAPNHQLDSKFSATSIPVRPTSPLKIAELLPTTYNTMYHDLHEVNARAEPVGAMDPVIVKKDAQTRGNRPPIVQTASFSEEPFKTHDNRLQVPPHVTTYLQKSPTRIGFSTSNSKFFAANAE
ncbi:putative mitochondrial protein [Andalucia godoyi]|uniref:Putative mitochondrial protein n=1 Tax=Andalucia godoyi TaxID=505711 RepID=A0A8K0AHJ4_ANDGO|nr:putative mitochondrial protein [Andalucia godoyi]|eukprot:ANDGO_01571.mRNA.1 putative mitochondrial protein